MLQRVNPLVLNKIKNINRRIYPSEQQKKEAIPIFETASFLMIQSGFPSFFTCLKKLFLFIPNLNR